MHLGAVFAGLRSVQALFFKSGRGEGLIGAGERLAAEPGSVTAAPARLPASPTASPTASPMASLAANLTASLTASLTSGPPRVARRCRRGRLHRAAAFRGQ